MQLSGVLLVINLPWDLHHSPRYKKNPRRVEGGYVLRPINQNSLKTVIPALVPPPTTSGCSFGRNLLTSVRFRLRILSHQWSAGNE